MNDEKWKVIYREHNLEKEVESINRDNTMSYETARVYKAFFSSIYGYENVWLKKDNRDYRGN